MMRRELRCHLLHTQEEKENDSSFTSHKHCDVTNVHDHSISLTNLSTR